QDTEQPAVHPFVVLQGLEFAEHQGGLLPDFVSSHQRFPRLRTIVERFQTESDGRTLVLVTVDQERRRSEPRRIALQPSEVFQGQENPLSDLLRRTARPSEERQRSSKPERPANVA